MKRLGILALALALFSLPAFAGPGKHRHGPSPEKIAQELGLDSAQTEQFVAIVTEQREKHRAARKSLREQGVSRDEAHAHHQAMRAETRERLSGVLTGEQLDQLDALRHEHKMRRKHRERADGEDGTI